MPKSDQKHTQVLPGQVYAGVASRYVFPPDVQAWWHRHGSYAIAIVSVGRIWFEYESFLVSKDGTRAAIEPRQIKRARLEEFKAELKSGAMTLKPPDRPEVTLVDDTAEE